MADPSRVQAPNSAPHGASTTVTASTQHMARSWLASNAVDLASDLEGSEPSENNYVLGEQGVRTDSPCLMGKRSSDPALYLF